MPTRLTIRALATALFTCLLCASAFTQGKQAVLIMRANTANATTCDGALELEYVIVGDFKIRGKDELRLLNAGSSPNANPDRRLVGRKEYEDAPKNKYANLFQMRWNAAGFLEARQSENSSPFLAVPEDMKPPKDLNTPMAAFYSAQISGEVRDGKQKRKAAYSLNDMWKVYFVAEGANLNDVLFRHAREEKSLPVWEAFLRKTNNYRAGEANAGMREVLVACAQTALEQFGQGDYRALETARQRAARAQEVQPDDNGAQLLATITQHKQRVNNQREQVYQLSSASKWDEAIAAAEPIKIYLKTWPDLKALYDKALEESHKQHLARGKEALQGNQLETALNECATARERWPDSPEARTCLCSARNRIALRDAKAARERKRPSQAVELLTQQLSDFECGRDESLARELEGAKCDHALQLFDEAKQLVSGGAAKPAPARPAAGGRRPAATAAPARVALPGLKALTVQNKADFRAARDKLLQALNLCASDAPRLLLEAANRALAAYCLAEARKATQRSDFATAYVYLTTANFYTPDEGGINENLSQARTALEDKTRVSIGVIFENKAGYRGAEGVMQEVASEIEGIATRVGIAQPVILDRAEAARAWRAIQSGTPLPAPVAIFTGDVLAANATVNGSRQNLRGSYKESNPAWQQADRVHDNANAQLKQCRKQAGADCSGLENEVARLRAYRDRIPQQIERYFSYYETAYRAGGTLRLSFRYADSISRSVRSAETLEATANDQCLAREGVPVNIYGLPNQSCDGRIKDEQGYIDQMTAEIKRDAQQRAYALLQDLPLSFYKRARAAAVKPQAVEDYLRFLFLTSQKNSPDAEDAKKYLLAFDAELKTDGVLR